MLPFTASKRELCILVDTLLIKPRKFLHLAAEDAGLAKEGHEWYFVVNEISQKLAETHGVSPRTVAGIIAALSPRTAWEDNIQRAERLLEARNLEGIGLKHAVFAANEIQGGAEPLDVLRGQKVRAFFDNIANPDSSKSTTIDTHIWNMVFDDPRAMNKARLRIRPNEYKLIEGVFYAAARGVGLLPHQVQAAT